MTFSQHHDNQVICYSLFSKEESLTLVLVINLSHLISYTHLLGSKEYLLEPLDFE